MNSIFAATARLALSVIAVALMSTMAFAAGVRVDQTASDFETKIDTSELFEANKRGDVFVLRVGAGRALALEHERVLEGSDGARTWVGRLREGGSDNVVYVTEANGNVYATIPTSDSIFEIVARSGESAVVRDLAARGMRRKLNVGKDYVIPPVLGAPVSAVEQNVDRQKALPTPQVTIDVMIVYNDAFVSRYGANVATRMNNLIAQANDSYVRSEVAITLRLVRSEQKSYANATSNAVALQAIQSGAGVFSTVAASRDTYGADLVVLLRPFDDATHGGCGIAFVGGFNQTTLMSQFGYAVASDGSDLGGSGFLCLDKTFQHEMGHNMGLLHDRATVAADGGGTGATSYAFGYIIPGTNPSVGDIMSYADRAVNCFSSPLVYRQGTVSGLSGGSCNVAPTTGDLMGVASSNASSSADAAATLNFTRVTVSNFRTASTATITGTISNGSALANVTFCAKPATGVTCTASNGAGVYSCTVPNGWTGTLHSPSVAGFRIPPQVFSAVSTSSTRDVTAVAGVPTCNLDVDNNGLFEPDIDGVAILRRLAGFNSAAFAGFSPGNCAANTSAATIFNATNASNYNVTGGSAAQANATRDGLLLVRAIRGLTGTAVTNGITATSWTSLRSTINAACGSSFLP